MKRSLVGIAVLLVVGMASTASAQVNIEELRALAKRKGLSAVLTGHLEYQRGNTDLLTMGIGVGMRQVISDAHILFLNGVYEFGRKTEGDRHINNAFAHFRYNWEFSRIGFAEEKRDWKSSRQIYGLELFAQIQFDEFIRIKQRLLGGVGLRANWQYKEWFSVALGVGYMYEYEEYTRPDRFFEYAQNTSDSLIDRIENAHRFTSYFSIWFKVHPRLSFLTTTYFQPRLHKRWDVRVLWDTLLSVALWKSLFLTVKTSLRFDNDPYYSSITSTELLNNLGNPTGGTVHKANFLKQIDFTITNAIKYVFD